MLLHWLESFRLLFGHDLRQAMVHVKQIAAAEYVIACNDSEHCIADVSCVPLWCQMQTQFTSDDHCRLKCWECGVKKKAPCGQTQRDDLPWCCHRRLGEWIALHTVTRADNAQKSITFQSKHLLPFLRH